MCTRLSCPPPPECVTFATIRAALAECESAADRRGFPHGDARLAYVVAKLRAAAALGNPDCAKAADFLMQIYSPL